LKFKTRHSIYLLIFIMITIVASVMAVTITLLYKTAIDGERMRLQVAARSQARLIEAVAKFDAVYSRDYPLGAREATIKQIRDAHTKYTYFGETGEFVLSERQNGSIVFHLSHRQEGVNTPKPVPWNSELAEPMRLALSGKSGSTIAPDYSGVTVLAAYEPVALLNMGIVAKIDLSEIRAPFIRAGVISGIFACVIILAGIIVFFRITNPIVEKLERSVKSLEKALGEVKVLRGIIPICSFCKKVRNDEGYWSQVDEYLAKCTDADFSHSICPECLEKEYPEEYRKRLDRNTKKAE